MNQRRPIVPVMLIVAVFSRHRELLEWAQSQLEQRHGSIELSSDPHPFDQTHYYDDSMGSGLLKQLHAFHDLVMPDCLPTVKHACVALEQEMIASGSYPEARPVNVDPGYLTLGKLLLASTKDHAHRVYLNDGVFAEVTLFFRRGRFEAWPWTYSDYREKHVEEFLLSARSIYRRLRLSTVD